MSITKKSLLAAVSLSAFMTTQAFAESISLNVTGLVSTHIHHTALEQEFYSSLAEKTGVDVSVNFNPLDVIGVNMNDTLRLASDGTFDIVQSTVGNVARDDTFLEGIDLLGVSPDLNTQREAMEAFREAFNKRTEERLGLKTLTLYPFGPQHIFCKGEVSSLADLAGRRVRSYTRSMSAVLEHVGATPVSMTFAEVYPALQRGVVDCAITSITSANSGSWPEITTHVLTLALSHGMNANFMNLDKWNSMSPDAQAKMEAAFKELEEGMWGVTTNMYEDGIRCSTGKQPCEHYTAFNMTEVAATEADLKLLAEAVDAVVLDVWTSACQPQAECVSTWNDTVGEVRGFEMSVN